MIAGRGHGLSSRPTRWGAQPLSTTTITKFRITSLSAAAALVAALLVGPGATDAMAVTCDKAGATLNVNLASGQSAEIRRTNGDLTVTGGCTGNPTVDNIDTIDVSGAPGDETFTVDMTNGLFRPGATVETQGDSEIEVIVSLGDGNDTLVVQGRPVDDALHAGSAGINFNGDGDADITRNNVEELRLGGADGADSLSAAGGLAAGDPLNTGVTLAGGEGGDTLQGGNGNDTLNGGNGGDAESGGAGDDTFNQTTDANGADLLNGDEGTDTADYGARTVGVNVTLDGNADDGAAGEGDNATSTIENVRGGSGNDTITGSLLANVLRGGEGNDTINGADGDDTLIGAEGSDNLIGGTGTDTAGYGNRTASVTVTIDGVANDGELGESDNVAVDVENVNGGAAADLLVGSDANNTLDGNKGDDTLIGLGGSDAFVGGEGIDTVTYEGRTEAVAVTIDGVANDGAAGENDNVGADVENVTGGTRGDSLTGSAANNALNGGPGPDTLNGSTGNDVESGGDGNDRFVQEAAANGADALNGGAGTDTVSYGSRVEDLTVTLDGLPGDGAPGEGDDVGKGVENVTAGIGVDTLRGSSRRNRLKGGRGADHLVGNRSSDSLKGGRGFDEIRGSEGDDALFGGENGDIVEGGNGEDRIFGGRGGDVLEGGKKADRVKGGSGRDALFGGQGRDSLNGGPGRDNCSVGPNGGSTKSC
jgi:Ca2+-binding RTX toxin-like protein